MISAAAELLAKQGVALREALDRLAGLEKLIDLACAAVGAKTKEDLLTEIQGFVMGAAAEAAGGDEARREAKELRERVTELEERIEYAMSVAARRWEEWGERAVSVCVILEGGDPYADQSEDGGGD